MLTQREINLEKIRREEKDFLDHHPLANLWQSLEWFYWQKEIGQEAVLKFFYQEKKIIASCLSIKKKLPGGQSWIYIPRGPLLSQEKYLEPVLTELKKENFIYLQLELPTKYKLQSKKFLPTKKEINPSDTILVDLKQTEDQILSQMKPKGRYNVKLAQKKGVKIKESRDLDAFYQMLLDTKDRDGFGIHSRYYYQKMLDKLPGKLFLAFSKEEKLLAGAILLIYKKTAIYYYGASSNQMRNLMAPYLLQWEMMRYAQKKGCENYDFLGIAPEGEADHPLRGVTNFKKKFGGQIISLEKGKIFIKKKILFRVLVFVRFLLRLAKLRGIISCATFKRIFIRRRRSKS